MRWCGLAMKVRHSKHHRANYRKADGSLLHHFITVLLSTGKYYHLFWSYLCYQKHEHRGDVGQTAQESPALSWGTHPAQGHCHVLAHDMPKIQTQTSSFVCTELEEQDSDGFTRIFHNPPPPVLYSVSSSVRANYSYNYCHNYYFNKNQRLIKILQRRLSRLLL